MLTVVQHHQELLVAQVGDERLRQRRTRTRTHLKYRRHRIHHTVRVTHRLEFTQPGAITEARQQFRRDLEGEARLAYPTDTGQRHHRRHRQGVRDPFEIVVTSYEGTQLQRQVARERIERV